MIGKKKEHLAMRYDLISRISTLSTDLETRAPRSHRSKAAASTRMQGSIHIPGCSAGNRLRKSSIVEALLWFPLMNQFRKWEIIHLCRDRTLFIIKDQSVASSKCCFIFTYYKTDIICATFVYFFTKIPALFFSLLYSICLCFIHTLTRSLLYSIIYSIFLVVSVCCYTVGRGTSFL